jgi:hypothetical protein
LFPLASEVVFRGEIGFPGLGIGKVHRVAVTVWILVAQASEAVSEFVDHYRTEMLAVGIGQVVGVVDSATTVVIGVYEDYDRTNYFYQSLGFKEFEVFPLLWDKDNPCQIYVMRL